MKLNLGCGGIYQKDHLNVDAFDNTVADEIMTATDLKLKDYSVEEIIASQLIEHVGLVSSIYALSECFRVLKPEGTITIETPDIKTSFKKYITGNRNDRKNILPWIYGLENPGLQHKFCFPNDLLNEICEKIGFTDITTEFFELDGYQPTLRLTCKKPSDHSHAQIITLFRKQLLQNNVVDLQNQTLALEQENLINLFVTKVRYLEEKNMGHLIDEITIEGAVVSPEMTQIFLKSLAQKNLIPREMIESHLKILKTLIKIDFLKILCNSLRKIPNMIGEQTKAFHTIINFGKISVKNLLDNRKKTTVIESLSKTKKKTTRYDTIEFFSEKMLLKKANWFFQLGSKEFILRNYDEAIHKFKLSIGFFRDQILSYWNLARLFVLSDNRQRAKKYYMKTLDLLSRLDCNNKEDIQNQIEEEITKIGKETPENPIISINDI